MEQRVSVITLAVRDLEKSRQFYESIGWKAGFSSDKIVFFELNGCVLGLYDRQAFVEETGLSGAPGGVALAWNGRTRDDVNAALKMAEQAGAQILQQASETFWGGYSGYFADPDGHGWEVAHNPGWPIDPSGNVHMKD